MTPASYHAVPTAYLPPIIGPLNNNANTLRIISVKNAEEATTPLKKLKPQQLIARMAFRLFGLERLPVSYAAASYMQDDIDMAPPIQAAQLMTEFKEINEATGAWVICENNVADYTSELIKTNEDAEVISFSKIAGNKEIVIAYNTSETEPKEKFILLHTQPADGMNTLYPVYGYEHFGRVDLFHGKFEGEDMYYIKIYLTPLQLIILKKS